MWLAVSCKIALARNIKGAHFSVVIVRITTHRKERRYEPLGISTQVYLPAVYLPFRDSGHFSDCGSF
jgi:hypothetical protein